MKYINAEYLRRRRKEDISFRLACNMRRRVHHLLQDNRPLRRDLLIKLLGCSFDELKTHLESQFLPTMTWENYGHYWHVDHIVPCTSFTKRFGDLKKCFHHSNLQPLFAVTQTIEGVTYVGNINKGGKYVNQQTECGCTSS